MASYKVEFSASAVKQIKALPKPYVKKVVAAIDALAANPYPVGCTKLTGADSYRIRVGIYRILYKVENDVLTVLILRVAHRKDVYR